MAQRKVKFEASSASRHEQVEPIQLSIEEARALMLAAQGLLDPPPAKPTRADVLAMIERLGVVQIDTINVVRRSQYLVLWSRLGAYDEALFDKLLHPERAIFEYWCHAAS
ncbi:MAG TPA: crosslink repair DNA glycosylase YcaQ family protein, partial [Ktedonobacterales bacterium]|nr:crosslink repair DNA glycosylase YcaQ family protein [Ktedonobacterales bacterium]